MILREEDKVRLLESRSDLDSSENPAAITTEPAFQAALRTSSEGLEAARAALVVALELNGLDLGETETERAKLRGLLATALSYYDYYRGSLPHRPPRVTPARGPPQAELDLDQSPAFDLDAPEAVPEFEFDQSLPQEWDA